MKNRASLISAIMLIGIGCGDMETVPPPSELGDSLPAPRSDETFVAAGDPNDPELCENDKLGAINIDVKRVVGDVAKLKANDKIAKTAIGEYSLRQHRGGEWSIWLREMCVSDIPGGVRETYSLDLAQHLAQQHFNGRARKLMHDLMEPSDG